MKKLLMVLIVSIFVSTPTLASGFDWAVSFDFQRQNSSPYYSNQLSVQFDIPHRHVSHIYNRTQSYSDTFIILRLSKLSGRSIDHVLRVHKRYRHKGWAVVAIKLGIRPGSEQYRILTRSPNHHYEKVEITRHRSSHRSQHRSKYHWH